MAQYIITGILGAGKTYLALDMMVNKWFTWSEATKEYIARKEITIISNIDGLKLPHVPLDDIMEKFALAEFNRQKKGIVLKKGQELDDIKRQFLKDKVRYFFNEKAQNVIKKKFGQVVYVIDECQRYLGKQLDREKWAREVFDFFEYQRHYGFDVYLISQNTSQISRGIYVLTELVTKALSRTLSIGGEFKYNQYTCEGSKLNAAPLVKMPKQSIFALYKSMSAPESEKIRRPLARILVGCSVALILGGVAIWWRWGKRVDEIQSAAGPKSHVAKAGHGVKYTDGKGSGRAPEKGPFDDPRYPRQRWIEAQSINPAMIGCEWRVVSHVRLGDKLWLLDPGTGQWLRDSAFSYALSVQGTKVFALLPSGFGGDNDRLF